MAIQQFLHSRFSQFIQAVLAFFAIAAITLGAASASTTKVIYSFAGGNDGEYLDTDLVMDSAGNLYGSTVQGGKFGSGTVFQLSPSSSGWTHTVLYSFTGGKDGGEPYKGVTLDAQGNLYGTAVSGGTGSCDGGCGVVFKLTNSGGSWTQSVIHYFTGGNDGSGPGSGLTFDSARPRKFLRDDSDWRRLWPRHRVPTEPSEPDGVLETSRVIHAFTGGADGSSASAGRLIFDHAGNLYVVATFGGANGHGVAFEISRGADDWMDANSALCLQGSARRRIALRRPDLRQSREIYTAPLIMPESMTLAPSIKSDPRQWLMD